MPFTDDVGITDNLSVQLIRDKDVQKKSSVPSSNSADIEPARSAEDPASGAEKAPSQKTLKP